MTSSLCPILCALLASSAMGGVYTFGGIDTPGGPWEWTGPGMDDLRAAIADPTRFGPAGVVPTPATTVTLATVDAASLAQIDCFVSPAIADGVLSPAQVTAIVNWFLAGGDLLLLDDRSDYDPIGQALGFPTLAGPGFGSGSFTATTLGAGPLVAGPFGTIASFLQYYLVGHLDEDDILAAGGSIAAKNSAGPAVAFWDEGQMAPAAGKLVIVTDVDTFADGTGYGGAADYLAMNANATLALNTVAFFLTDTCPADLDGNGIVDGADLGLLLAAWAQGGPADLDPTGSVDGADLGLLLAAWGPCP